MLTCYAIGVQSPCNACPSRGCLTSSYSADRSLSDLKFLSLSAAIRVAGPEREVVQHNGGCH